MERNKDQEKKRKEINLKVKIKKDQPKSKKKEKREKKNERRGTSAVEWRKKKENRRFIFQRRRGTHASAILSSQCLPFVFCFLCLFVWYFLVVVRLRFLWCLLLFCAIFLAEVHGQWKPSGYWFLPSFTGFYLALPSMTGFYLVLLGFT